MDNGYNSNRQTTLATPVSCTGIGLHSGAKASLTLLPAEPDTGIVFRRTDIDGGGAFVEARYDRVSATELGTTLTNTAGVSVATVEHLMAALMGLGIDNVVAEIAGPELPIMDGSAEAFVALLDRAGSAYAPTPRKLVRVTKPVIVSEGASRAVLMPCDKMMLACEIDFRSPAIGRQSVELTLTPSVFRREIARARTFGFLKDAETLRAKGLAQGASLQNAIVVDESGILNSEPLRFADEFVRHKVLDAVGDLGLAGAPLIGRYEGLRAGHALNNRLLRALFADETAWRIEKARPEPAEARRMLAVGAGF